MASNGRGCLISEQGQVEVEATGLRTQLEQSLWLPRTQRPEKRFRHFTTVESFPSSGSEVNFLRNVLAAMCLTVATVYEDSASETRPGLPVS